MKWACSRRFLTRCRAESPPNHSRDTIDPPRVCSTTHTMETQEPDSCCLIWRLQRGVRVDMRSVKT